MTHAFIGIDPGLKGGIGVIDQDGAHLYSAGFSDLSLTDVYDVISEAASYANGSIPFVMIEKVGSMPGQGVSSSFKFGRVTGWAEMAIVSTTLPWGDVSPAKWQGKLNCRTKGDKSVSLAAAQRLWPEVKMSKTGKKSFYDALLIAEYARRIRLGIE